MYVTNQVAFVLGCVNAVVGIQQFDIEHGRVLAPHGDGPRIGSRDLVFRLIRIIEYDTGQRAVGVQRQERRSLLLATRFGDQERGAVVGGLGQTPIADSVVGRDRFPDALECDVVRDIQVSGEPIVAARCEDGATSCLVGRVERLLKGGRIVGRAVTFGSVRSHVAHGWRVLAECCFRTEPEHACEDQRSGCRDLNARLRHARHLKCEQSAGDRAAQMSVPRDTSVHRNESPK